MPEDLEPGAHTEVSTTSPDGNEATVEPAATTQEPRTYSEQDIKAVREEAAKYRIKARDLTAQLEESKTEATKTAERVARIEEQTKQRLFAAEVDKAARAANVSDPDLLDALLARKASSVEYDDNGNPTNVAALVAAIVEAKPHLVNTPKAAPSTGAPAAPTRDPNKGLTKSALDAMTPAQIADLMAKPDGKAQIQAALNDASGA